MGPRDQRAHDLVVLGDQLVEYVHSYNHRACMRLLGSLTDPDIWGLTVLLAGAVPSHLSIDERYAWHFKGTSFFDGTKHDRCPLPVKELP